MRSEKVLYAVANHFCDERERVTARWRELVRQTPEVVSAARLNDTELTDHLPKVFDDLSGYLREPDRVGPRAEIMRTAKEHGQQRGDQGYEPGEVLRELNILHRVVALETLPALAQRDSLPETEVTLARHLISRFFEDVAVASTESFVEQWATRFKEANERLAEVDTSRLRLLRNVTHELAGFLQTLKFSLATALLPGLGEAERGRLIAIGDRALTDMGSLLQELRDYGMLLAGQAGPQWEPLEVKDFVEEIAEPWRLYTQQAGIKLLLDLGPGLEGISGDRRRLRQVVSNLTSNAIKYHDPVKAERWVRLGFERLDPERWSIVVEDNGVGITPGNLEVIFNEFGRAAPELGIQGSGLGLAITRRLTEGLGGEIRVQSQPGHGSRFEVILPTAPKIS
ncbi:MAG TPA: sensor histidine kinase [Chthoniobacterales bacterium]